MPVQICLAAAQELCAVLSAYVEDLSRLPCDVIFPIVLAAATLWQCRKEFDASHDRAEVKAQIDLCVRCLAIVGKIWKNAGDCRRRLIKGECQYVSIDRTSANVRNTDFAGATSTPTPTVNDIPLRQPCTANSEHQMNGHAPVHPDTIDDATAATFTSIEERNQLAPASSETTYSFLDAIDSRLDDFATADEEFRAYLEAQLGQYEFPIF
jgi:hypothetical protein